MTRHIVSSNGAFSFAPICTIYFAIAHGHRRARLVDVASLRNRIRIRTDSDDDEEDDDDDA